jgi:hypothetical protein
MKMFERHKIRGIRRVSKKELRELSKLPWVPDETLSSSMDEARVLPDGRVLLVSRDIGTADLFPSRKEVEQWHQYAKETQAEWAQRGGRFDPAKELLPPRDEFIRDVEKHAKGLGNVLHIPDEALDRSVESLDLVDKAVGRMRIAKRMTPEVFTPLTAYLGEVMRLVCDGRWARLPATIKKSRPVYDPAEHAAHQAAENAVLRAAGAAATKAAADAMARGVGDRAATRAHYEARRAVLSASTTPPLMPLRWDEYEEPIDGHEHEPVIRAHDGGLVSPVASLVRTLSERSTYGSLRTAVEGKLARYLNAKRKAGSTG